MSDGSVIIVGAARLAEALDAVACDSMTDAGKHLPDPAVTLVVSDTYLTGSAIDTMSILRAHGDSGGRSIALRSTDIEEALVWDVSSASEVVMPATVGEVAEILGLAGPRSQELVVVDQPLEMWRDHDDPIVAFKRGALALGDDREELRMFGAFAGAEVPMCCDKEPGSEGFYSFVERHTVEGAFYNAAIFTVHLSGKVTRLAYPRASGNHFVAEHQCVAKVEMIGRCHICKGPSSVLALWPRDWGSQLAETCDAHVEQRETVSYNEVRALLGDIPMTFVPPGVR